MTAAHCTHGAVSSYAYLGAHNLYSEEEGRLIIFTQVIIMSMGSNDDYSDYSE